MVGVVQAWGGIEENSFMVMIDFLNMVMTVSDWCFQEADMLGYLQVESSSVCTELPDCLGKKNKPIASQKIEILFLLIFVFSNPPLPSKRELGLGWPVYPGLPGTFLVLALKFCIPETVLSPAEIRTVDHLKGDPNLRGVKSLPI